MSGSSFRLELISTDDACRPSASSSDVSRVCLSLQSPYWLWNVGGGVGLVAPQAQRQAYVAEILGDVVIEPFDFGDIAVEALGKFLGFRADLRRWLPAVMIEAGVPAANFFPTAEGG